MIKTAVKKKKLLTVKISPVWMYFTFVYFLKSLAWKWSIGTSFNWLGEDILKISAFVDKTLDQLIKRKNFEIWTIKVIGFSLFFKLLIKATSLFLVNLGRNVGGPNFFIFFIYQKINKNLAIKGSMKGFYDHIDSHPSLVGCQYFIIYWMPNLILYLLSFIFKKWC